MSSKPEKEKVGVYICHCGGNISDHVDVEQLADEVRRIPGVTAVHTNMFMCSDPGQELIQNDIKQETINRVVVASCAPSLHEQTFRSAIKRADLNPYLYEHANIREQVSWVHDGEKATGKAVRLVSAAIAKATNLKALEPIRVDARNHATVIGAGVAGLRAAIDLSRRGIEVALVEKSPFLSGQAANLDTLVPGAEKAGDLVQALTDQVLADDKITVYTCSEIVRSEGYVGNFKITLNRRPPQAGMDLEKLDRLAADKGKTNAFIPFVGVYPHAVPSKSDELTVETGAIIFATGFKTYRPREGEYGFGTHPFVITLPELIRQTAQAATAGRHLTIKGRQIERVALMHCVGSRQIPGIHEPQADDHLNEYCSRTCCSATLQAAVQIRQKHPATHVFEFYRDIRTYGRGQEDYYEQASKSNVTFFRFEPENQPVVSISNDTRHPLTVTVKDSLTFNEEIDVAVDLIVLAVGMEPGDITDLVDKMKLPVGADRFLLEVHPKLRPVEVANNGILLAGTCQAPMDVGEACNAAQAAAAKASILLSKGYVELDPFVAEVDLQRCSGQGTCVAECPIEGAIRMVAMPIDGQTLNRARVNPALCTGCGMCVAVCPHNAIDVKGWALKEYEDMVDAIVAA
jgi:heterodisulfide reductase subunit A